MELFAEPLLRWMTAVPVELAHVRRKGCPRASRHCRTETFVGFGVELLAYPGSWFADSSFPDIWARVNYHLRLLGCFASLQESRWFVVVLVSLPFGLLVSARVGLVLPELRH